MEKEKRKKMSPAEENGGGVVEETKKKKKIKKKRDEREREAEEPTTEEVEEFYTILRRMDVALRYLKGTQTRISERRTTEETAAVVDGDNKELNLNEVPEDSSN